MLELFKFFDDGRGHREFADLAKPEKKDHFLAVVYPRREAGGVGVWRWTSTRRTATTPPNGIVR